MPGLLGIDDDDTAAQQQQGSTDSDWVQALKLLIHPNVDPRALVTPRYQNTDPGLNRLGPRVGNVVGT